MDCSPDSVSSPNSHNLSGFSKAQEQDPGDLFENGVDETRVLSGKVLMVWSDETNTGETEALVSVQRDLHDKKKDPYIFSILLKLKAEYNAAIDLQPNDEFQLSLRGAVLKNKSNPRPNVNLSMSLVYSSGVHIEYLRAGGRKTVNTFILQARINRDENSWMGSPSKLSATPTRIPAKRKLEEDVSEDAMQIDHISTVSKSESRKKRKKERKEKKKEVKRLKSSGELRHSSKTPVKHQDIPITTPPSAPIASDAPRSERHVDKKQNDTTSSRWLMPQAKAIQQLEQSPHGTVSNIAGIVLACSAPKRTSSGDWSTCVKITDPSYSGSSVKINCFQKLYEAWLPHPNVGDVIIFRGVKKQGFNSGFNCVGYSDRLQWAAVTASATLHYGPPSDVPREQRIGSDGGGCIFSPFYEPSNEDLLCCKALLQWWEQQEGSKFLEQSPSAVVSAATRGNVDHNTERTHHLIEDVSPKTPPKGFFDCTIEVLKGFSSEYHQNMYTLYVTDYTHNDKVRAIRSNWCAATLQDKVLTVEMWGDAAAKARTMKQGEFYSLKNVLMRVRDGYFEAKMNETDIERLKKGGPNKHLVALLERKQAYEAGEGNKEHEISDSLLQDVVGTKFFHGTVELLQPLREPLKGDLPHIFVTDYTPNEGLESLVIDEPWARGLEGYILKITLSEEQLDFARLMEPGRFYRIRNLRLKSCPQYRFLKSHLGGNARLVYMLNPDSAGNPNLNALLRRKEQWEFHNAMEQPTKPPAPSEPPKVKTSRPDEASIQSSRASPQVKREVTLSPPALPAPSHRIQDFPPYSERSKRVRVRAQVDIYSPMDIKDAIQRLCSNCRAKLPPTQKACTICGDLEHEFVKLKVKMNATLKDEDGQRIIIAIESTGSEMWRDLIRTDPPTEITIHKYWERLSPCLGNLPDVQQAYLKKETKAKNCPWVTFELERWMVDEEQVAYKLIRYNL